MQKLLTALTLAAALGICTGAAARSNWDLSGIWYDPGGNPYVVTQSGSALSWDARSLDEHTWAHDFKGRISGNTFSGTYHDRPGFDRQFHGTITGRIKDACHMTVWFRVVGGTDVSGPLEKKPCQTRFRFAWNANASWTEDRGRAQYTAKLRGGGTFVIDGIGTLKGSTGTLRLFHHLEVVADVWRITIDGGRYHEDPVPTAELKVEAVSAFSGKCDARPNGTLTLVDGGSKRPDRAVLTVCGERISFTNSSGASEGEVHVLLAELN